MTRLRVRATHGSTASTSTPRRRCGADPDRVEIPARTEDEPRWLVIGRITGLAYSAVITYRGERVRLISVRRARKEEVAIYEG